MQLRYSCLGISNVVTKQSKVVDLKLAIHIASHSAIRSMDHLGELLKVFGKGSCLENLRMHRTKCAKLILNVISPSIIEELVSDIGDKRYSLIVDESTDISVSKYMAYCIRYKIIILLFDTICPATAGPRKCCTGTDCKKCRKNIVFSIL